MNKVTVNGKTTYEVDGAVVNGAEFLTDIVQTGERFFNVLQDGKSYSVEVVKSDATSKTITLKVNNSIFEMHVKDKFDQLLDQMGLKSATKQMAGELKAPMPGMVIDVRVEIGQQVKKGDAVLVLEAMKMENVLKAAGDGIVKSIEAVKGKNVEKGQVLIVFE